MRRAIFKLSWPRLRNKAETCLGPSTGPREAVRRGTAIRPVEVLAPRGRKKTSRRSRGSQAQALAEGRVWGLSAHSSDVATFRLRHTDNMVRSFSWSLT